jgi:hypothetical protein
MRFRKNLCIKVANSAVAGSSSFDIETKGERDIVVVEEEKEINNKISLFIITQSIAHCAEMAHPAALRSF